MKIHVGTENPVKIEAVREALSCYELFSGADIIGKKTESGVRAQPLTLDETVLGAKRRAIRALPGSQYSIGLESGAHTIDQSKWMELTVCCWYGGENFHYGYSSAFEIPPSFIPLLQKGLDLQQVCIELGITSNQQLGRAEGLVGILSAGRLSRKEYTKQAVITAVFSSLNLSLYHGREDY